MKEKIVIAGVDYTFVREHRYQPTENYTNGPTIPPDYIFRNAEGTEISLYGGNPLLGMETGFDPVEPLEPRLSRREKRKARR